MYMFWLEKESIGFLTEMWSYDTDPTYQQISIGNIQMLNIYSRFSWKFQLELLELLLYTKSSFSCKFGNKMKANNKKLKFQISNV